ncbi:cell division protein ZapA [Rhodocaloribacter litoris]|uniref:cell division protein ZapA n=1 Tax=Rhodocaloribacter litoris TaxID=2558931 RepID=UPI0014218D10|nr:cell division protein ZapA [Rhodocaloribacter litoris]QXD15005.1 cell division protein ZapA [Rhodocaloribacter litoris]GIV62206.1 MAG: hypothetical protein KatS3mg044_1072 [Rhodothermaceae bacterium]
MEKTIRVQLQGRNYGLRVAPELEDRMRAAAAYVEEKLDAFRTAHPEQSELTAALMTALALADELFAAREGFTAQDEALTNDLDLLNEQLREALAGP